jgi:hypothetical protein
MLQVVVVFQCGDKKALPKLAGTKVEDILLA